MKINIKYLGDCKHDMGLFPDELADAYTNIPDKVWADFVNARHEYEMMYETVNNYRQKKIRSV